MQEHLALLERGWTTPSTDEQLMSEGALIHLVGTDTIENPMTDIVESAQYRHHRWSPTDFGRSHRRRNQSPTPTESHKSLSVGNSTDFVDDRQGRAVVVKHTIWRKGKTNRKEPVISIK